MILLINCFTLHVLNHNLCSLLKNNYQQYVYKICGLTFFIGYQFPTCIVGITTFKCISRRIFNRRCHEQNIKSDNKFKYQDCIFDQAMKSSSNEKEINPHQSNCTKTNTVVPVLQYYLLLQWKKWSYKRGGLFWQGQLSGILLSVSNNWPDKRGDLWWE